MAQPANQTSFASGEWAPKLRSRVDIQKYRLGAALLRNFYVDWAGGGASTRQGTEFIAMAAAPGARLIAFQPSATVTYVLEFGNFYIRFYSNGKQILLSGSPYQIATSYPASDLFPDPTTGNPGIKFVQDVTSLIITHPNHQPQILTILAPTNWTLTAINFGATIDTPTNLGLLTSLVVAANSWSYAYTVSAVDVDGQESTAATPVTLLNFKSLSDPTAPGTNTLSWNAVTGATSYNIYKASPIFNTTFPTVIPVGFIGNTTSLSFTDTTPGFAPDFSQTPPIAENPFLGAGVASISPSATGSYSSVPSVTVSAPPAGGGTATAQAVLGATSITILSGGTGFVAGSVYDVGNTTTPTIFTILVTTVGGSGDITSASINWPGSIVSGSVPSNPLAIQGPGAPGSLNVTNWGVVAVNVIQAGAGYTSTPSVTFTPAGASATATLGDPSLGNPSVPAFFQERLVLAAQTQAVQSFNMSQPGSFFNFDVSFPAEDDDAISGTIISEELNAIKSLTTVPTGLLALSAKSAWLINGGGGISTSAPVTPSTVTASPQAFNGASDLKPLRINMNILYVTYKGNYVRDMTYNIYANIFTGTDITTISNHLFFDFNVIDWCWAEEPFKTVWAVRDDGLLLSLGYVKDQELAGWAHHDTNGQFKSVCSVVETGPAGNTTDAVYVIVERTINGAINQYVERMQNRFLHFGAEDSWSVDCAIQNPQQVFSTKRVAISGDASAIGNTVVLFSAGTPFTAIMATQNWVVRAEGGIYKITAFTSSSQVTAQVVRVTPNLNHYTSEAYDVTSFITIWKPVSSLTIPHLPNTPVVGVADGIAFSGTTDGSGNLNVGFTFTKSTCGLAFTPQLQTLPLDLGEPTVQSKRKKVPAATLRVADTLGLQIGTSFANVVTVKDFQLGAIPTQSNGPAQVTDLYSGDGRQILDQVWQEPGQLCVQQNLPYPATILGVMPEVVVGDSPEPGGRRG